MANHNSIKLELHKDKPENVYRYIEDWTAVPSSHAEDIFYLILRGVFQWGTDRGTPVQGYSIAMQYSSEAGHNIDVSQPPHILDADADRVQRAFSEFISKHACGAA